MNTQGMELICTLRDVQLESRASVGWAREAGRLTVKTVVLDVSVGTEKGSSDPAYATRAERLEGQLERARQREKSGWS